MELQPLPPLKLAPRKARPHGRVDVGVPAINRSLPKGLSMGLQHKPC